MREGTVNPKNFYVFTMKRNHLKMSEKYTEMMKSMVCTGYIQENTSPLPTSVDVKAGKSLHEAPELTLRQNAPFCSTP